MIHKQRRFSVKPASLAEIQADFEKTGAWTACSSYRVEHERTSYLLLNDAFDGSGSELAICRVLREGARLFLVQQVESLTICWVAPEDIPAQLIKCFNQGAIGRPFMVTCEDWQDHQCQWCA